VYFHIRTREVIERRKMAKKRIRKEVLARRRMTVGISDDLTVAGPNGPLPRRTDTFHRVHRCSCRRTSCGGNRDSSGRCLRPCVLLGALGAELDAHAGLTFTSGTQVARAAARAAIKATKVALIKLVEMVDLVNGLTTSLSPHPLPLIRRTRWVLDLLRRIRIMIQRRQTMAMVQISRFLDSTVREGNAMNPVLYAMGTQRILCVVVVTVREGNAKNPEI